jgi:hypothetical protein
MSKVEQVESLDDIFVELLEKLDIDDSEKINLVNDFSNKTVSEQLLMVKMFESRVKSEQEKIQQRYVEQNKRRMF